MYAIQDVFTGEYADMAGGIVQWVADPNNATKFYEHDTADELSHELGVQHGLTCDAVKLLICEFLGGRVCDRLECDPWCRFEHERRAGAAIEVCSECGFVMGEGEQCPMCGGRESVDASDYSWGLE